MSGNYVFNKQLIIERLSCDALERKGFALQLGAKA
jgi:hypothetical protein